jgi:hypothetical protein
MTAQTSQCICVLSAAVLWHAVLQEHGLLLYLDRNAYLLMAIDEKRALELLASHLDTLPPGTASHIWNKPVV